MNDAAVPPPAEGGGLTNRLGLRPRDAAKALGISPRTLWSLTNRKLVPHIRLGRAVIYPLAELQRWLAEQAEKAARKQ